jgi:hypothetical protein
LITLIEKLIEEYYISIKNQVSNEKEAAEKAIEIWISFGEMCTEGILNNFKDNAHIEKVISSIDILKEMVQFHIDAAQRNRYARAAYYCSIIKNIYTCMNMN